MEVLFYILVSTFGISLLSFSGALSLFLKEELINKVLLFLVAFSAGALIGGAFLHLLPEAIEDLGSDSNSLLIIFLFLIFGFLTFFFLEQFIRWHHHHSMKHPDVMPFSYLILVSDSIHNFIDGLVIAASFAVDLSIGFMTALSVALHEIPQEIGDFGVMVYGGIKKTRALLFNFLSATTVILGGIVGFIFSKNLDNSIVFLLPFAAGGFIYIASADLIPEIKHGSEGFKKSLIHSIVFLCGLGLMVLMKLFLN